MGVYDRQIASAKRLIAAKGQNVIWRRLSISTPLPDVNKPWKPGDDTTVDVSVSIVFVPVNRVGNELIHLLKGTEIATGSLKGLMGAVSFEPSIKDVVIRGDKTLRIKSIEPIAPNGDIIIYTIEFDE